MRRVGGDTIKLRPLSHLYGTKRNNVISAHKRLTPPMGRNSCKVL